MGDAAERANWQLELKTRNEDTNAAGVKDNSPHAEYVPTYSAPQLFRWKGYWVEIRRTDNRMYNPVMGPEPIATMYLTSVLRLYSYQICDWTFPQHLHSWHERFKRLCGGSPGRLHQDKPTSRYRSHCGSGTVPFRNFPLSNASCIAQFWPSLCMDKCEIQSPSSTQFHHSSRRSYKLACRWCKRVFGDWRLVCEGRHSL